MYITVAVLFVLLSIFVLVASTENAFTRGLTTEEWLDYFDDDEKEMYAGLLGLTTHAKGMISLHRYFGISKKKKKKKTNKTKNIH